MPRTALIGLVALQMVGLALSAFLVFVTLANPQQVEDRLRAFAIAEVQEAADAAWSTLSGDWRAATAAERLAAFSDRLGVDATLLEQRRHQIVPALLAAGRSDTCVENCAFWTLAAAAADSALVQRMGQMRVGQDTLQDFLSARYDSSVQGLLTDLRRFGLVNVIALALMIALVLVRGRNGWKFHAFSAAVTGYAIWASWGYVFGQNWALSILFQDWAAPGYQAGMLFASALFFDWLFLRGTVTQTIGNAIASALPG